MRITLILGARTVCLPQAGNLMMVRLGVMMAIATFTRLLTRTVMELTAVAIDIRRVTVLLV